MSTMPLNMEKRPLSPILIIAAAFGVMVLAFAAATYLALGPQVGQTVWVLVRLAWRLVPPYFWLVGMITAVFWLWLIRHLWANGAAQGQENGLHASAQENIAFFI